MILILLHDDTWYLLNVYVQSIGYYLQNILQLGFHTGKNKFNRNDTSSFFTFYSIVISPKNARILLIFYCYHTRLYCAFIGVINVLSMVQTHQILNL